MKETPEAAEMPSGSNAVDTRYEFTDDVIKKTPGFAGGHGKWSESDFRELRRVPAPLGENAVARIKSGYLLVGMLCRACHAIAISLDILTLHHVEAKP